MTPGIFSMSFRSLRMAAVVLTVLAGGLALAQPAYAQSLDDAKAQGLIGERIDGLLGAPAGSVPADIAAMIERINSERLQKYRSIATSNGTSVQAVQAIVGRKLIEKTPSGQFIDNGGGWQRK
jgi:uncharacterized protein YdbL (DUF1318 family)